MTSEEPAAPHEDNYYLHNDGDSPIKVIIEPWAESYEVLPGERWDFLARAPVPGEVEIVHVETGVVLILWSGATMEILRDGQVFDTLSTPAFPTPPHLSMRQFLNLLFGMESEGDKEP